ARADLQQGRDVFGVVHEAPHAVAADARDGERHGTVVDGGVEREPEILAAEGDGLLVVAGGLVQHQVWFGHVARAASISGDGVRGNAVRGVTPIRRNRQVDDVAVGGGREQVAYGERWWCGVAIGNVERHAVGHDTARVNERNGSVPQCVRIELAPNESVGREEEMRYRELDRVLEVPVLRLKVMLGQVHALAPHHSGELRHECPEPVRLDSITLSLETAFVERPCRFAREMRFQLFLMTRVRNWVCSNSYRHSTAARAARGRLAARVP